MRIWHKDQLDKPNFIYFIATEDYRQVKVGVSKDPKKRLKDLQTGCPVKLVLVGEIFGGYSRERELHEIFLGTRTSANNEWFDLRGRVLAFMEKEKLIQATYAQECHRARSIREAMWDLLSDDELDSILEDPAIAQELFYKSCFEKRKSL